MGAGAGIRIDVQFFVIRFDVAMPVRVPNGEKPGTTPTYNIAIGYPF
ncbi:hypothetical protein [Hymenobacter cellulosilyticus]|uniref:Bacterial surface antigen (D15) domain-containing protein n=1 Tax=Hymenobacter cellulosilyticus TaxID=2932248 RepID=A0A8T9QAF3_9BACT|nr:hypothetical protein [Hymenobacter cellulosilyticus]UOQ73118.1 hypothetical protein MUN79_03860 [Hymenobacter cellulosilyticus]